MTPQTDLLETEPRGGVHMVRRLAQIVLGACETLREAERGQAMAQEAMTAPEARVDVQSSR